MSGKNYLPEFVYGGTDGTITTFAIISGSFGASLPAAVALILGFANLFADGFSMAASNYLSVKAGSFSKPPLTSALATFFSFVIVGSLPLLAFLLSGQRFAAAALFTALAFVIIGLIKGATLGRGRFASAAETVIIGGVAASVAYLVGLFLKSMF